MKRRQGRQETIDVTEASRKTSNNICHHQKYVVLNNFEKKKSKFSRCSLDFQQHFYQLEVHIVLPIATEHVKSSAFLPDLPSAKSCQASRRAGTRTLARSQVD